jgi:hypothetical protein
MPLLALAITDDASRSALLSTHLIQGQQCAKAPLDPGGATKQLPARRHLALEGSLTAEPAWAAERRRRRPQEHGWASQRAVARRGGPGGPDAGRAVVTCPRPRPASGVRCPVRATSIHACLSTGPCPASGAGVRCLCVAASAVSGRSEVLERGGGQAAVRLGWPGSAWSPAASMPGSSSA